MNIITISRKFGFVFMAGILAVSLIAPMTTLASEDGYDYYGGGYDYDTTDYYGGGYDYDTTDYYGGDYEYDTAYEDGYTGGSSYGSGSTGSGFSMPSFGGSGSSYSMPSFGSANYNYRTAYDYPTYSQPSKTSSNTTVTTNTCTNNSCNSSYVDNSIVDNSIKINDSYNTVVTKEKKQKKEEYRNDCYGYEYGYQNQGYGYSDYGYNQGNNYNDCYVAPPIAYNPTPYITLSQTPYTGLDLGPMGEVLYWTFLVLWCLGAAYLIVVKRVQNKLVGFLNGFLFGSSAKGAAHATHAPAVTAHAAAPAVLAQEGTDPFIQSQIKRS